MFTGGTSAGGALFCVLAALATSQKHEGVRGGALSGLLRFDGPFLHEGLLGGMMSLDCAVSEEARKFIVRRVISGHAAGASSLRWAHRNWDQVIDPWGGDGRRSYLANKPSEDEDATPKEETEGQYSGPARSLMGTSLRIIGLNPTDAGVYACIYMSSNVSNSLRIDLQEANLVSIHVLRVTERKRGEKTQEERGSFFDAWTWHLYKFTDSQPDEVVFEADCHANILLAGLVLRHLDKSFIRLGWKFTPRGLEPPSPPQDRSDLTPWDLRPPSVVCRGPVSDCLPSDPSDEANSDSDSNDGDEGNLVQDLLDANKQAVQRWWRARWLRLFADQELASGTWQCWLEGLDLQGWSPGRPRELTRAVLAEMRIFVTTREPFSWRNTVEAWRVLAVITAPLCYLLFYLLVGIAWAGSNRWRRLLYHAPPTRRVKTKQQKPETDEELEERRRTWIEGIPKAYNFDPKEYLDDFLTSEGINVRAKRWRRK
ncbi:unnamed protein product [Schistocephalus solidus]|uniref:Ig-like domain-containing protein n=1 Tax=Schistocephalus solidus TaxID=70667 RepID=A0A183TT10_SCHSO|nr:unnamed protein product [Schistocephalus solidus]